MSDDDLISAMRRKAGVGRPPPEVTSMSSAKALRLAAAKAAEYCTGMVMQVTDVMEKLTSTSRLPDQISDNSLLALLEGPENAYGLAVFSLAVTTSVVEQMTTGNVQKHMPEERKPTSTDSVMCFELIDQMLAHFEHIVQEAADPPDIEGYRTAAQLSETRSIPIAFDDIRYRMFHMTVDLGQGLRSGEIMFIYPASRPKPKPELGSQSDWQRDFKTSVMRTEANLDTVLHRVSLPLLDAANLGVGMTIPIPHKALMRVELVADGRRVSFGRLGQVDGHRAIRVDMDAPASLDGHHDTGDGLSGLGKAGMGGTDFPALEADGMPDNLKADMQSADAFPAMKSMSDDFPSLGDMGGDLPPLGDIGDLGDLSDFSALGDLPSID
ncbi:MULTISPECIES: FliM/FliN family flagellar motor switch protein [Pacificibacter]|uniref:FliM/FliN family flagellar motor switch protein n=1 Tax=Pacificibacter TaxID=1042323 RepID=UPI001C089CD9|nr:MULTISPECIES: flagellar motor switch protein FliM [Pacificibacter]MBU2936225.1 FliM/FliN family flagellar motor switch protein [Pacificibacter marinus]MDO6616782.1 FliM/FliN family flagellar motor switch protein [Pacificibacter sp. 1_MG-2023]